MRGGVLRRAAPPSMAWERDDVAEPSAIVAVVVGAGGVPGSAVRGARKCALARLASSIQEEALLPWSGQPPVSPTPYPRATVATSTEQRPKQVSIGSVHLVEAKQSDHSIMANQGGAPGFVPGAMMPMQGVPAGYVLVPAAAMAPTGMMFPAGMPHMGMMPGTFPAGMATGFPPSMPMFMPQAVMPPAGPPEGTVGSVLKVFPLVRPGPPIQVGAEQQGPPGANVFIFHLPNDMTNRDLFHYFVPFGPVLSARIIVDRDSGRSRGFGFVSFGDPAHAAASIATLDGIRIGHKRLKVTLKKEGGDGGGQHAKGGRGRKGAAVLEAPPGGSPPTEKAGAAPTPAPAAAAVAAAPAGSSGL